MVYLFEFFTIGGCGDRLSINTTKHREVTAALADGYAQATMRDVLFDGQRATVCVIKDQVGHTLREVIAVG
jgi:methyl coenzyme M reductase gamma subunit